jgi:predicted transcriptional regulator YdeE
MENVKIEPFKFIGIAIRTTNEGGQAGKEIAELWGKFLGENFAAKIPNKSSEEIFSLYTEYEGDHTQPYTAMLGCRVDSLDEIPEGMTEKSFDGGEYVKSSVRGDLADGIILKQWSRIFESDLNRNYAVDFEIFGAKAQNPQDAEVDFYVGVK